MPKEKIYDNVGPYIPMSDSGELPADQAEPGSGLGPVLQRGLTVRWNQKEFVEIGVDAFCTATGERVLGSGAYTTFDRQGINRMIQSLRKARDQAFGRDE